MFGGNCAREMEDIVVYHFISHELDPNDDERRYLQDGVPNIGIRYSFHGIWGRNSRIMKLILHLPEPRRERQPVSLVIALIIAIYNFTAGSFNFKCFSFIYSHSFIKANHFTLFYFSLKLGVTGNPFTVHVYTALFIIKVCVTESKLGSLRSRGPVNKRMFQVTCKCRE